MRIDPRRVVQLVADAVRSGRIPIDRLRPMVRDDVRSCLAESATSRGSRDRTGTSAAGVDAHTRHGFCGGANRPRAFRPYHHALFPCNCAARCGRMPGASLGAGRIARQRPPAAHNQRDISLTRFAIHPMSRHARPAARNTAFELQLTREVDITYTPSNSVHRLRTIGSLTYAQRWRKSNTTTQFTKSYARRPGHKSQYQNDFQPGRLTQIVERLKSTLHVRHRTTVGFSSTPILSRRRQSITVYFYLCSTEEAAVGGGQPAEREFGPHHPRTTPPSPLRRLPPCPPALSLALFYLTARGIIRLAPFAVFLDVRRNSHAYCTRWNRLRHPPA